MSEPKDEDDEDHESTNSDKSEHEEDLPELSKVLEPKKLGEKGPLQPGPSHMSAGSVYKYVT